MPTREFPEGVALVVGGSGGIGSAVVRKLAERGARVAFTYRGSRARAEDLAAELIAGGAAVSAHPLDLADPAACAALVETLAARDGRVHGLVHAAGSKISQPFIAQMDLDEWRRVLDADVNGFVHVAKPLLGHFRANGGGSITVISTAGLDRFPPGDILSIGPKGAIEALLRGIAREEGRFGTRANSVGIGVFEGGMFPDLVARGELDAKWIEAAKKNVALRRFGEPDEVAEAICFLASTRASYVTGQRLMLDGGYAL